MLDSVGIADIKAGRIDPRVIGVLTKLSQEHKIKVSCMCSDHSKFTAGGSVSNHFFGRGVDIAAIDGEIVGPGSPLAREVASELSPLDPNIRPNEIGSPWAISGPGYFTDGAHQNHLHLGFKQEITPRLEAARRRRGDRAGRSPPPSRPRRPARRVAAAAAVPAGPDLAQGLAGVPAGRRREGRRGLEPRRARRLAAAFLQARRAPRPRPRSRPRRPPPPSSPRRRARRARAAPVADVAAVAASAPDAYPGDDAPREQIAAWMAGQAQKRGLPPQSCR